MRDANAITTDLTKIYFGLKGRFNRARAWRHSLLAFVVAGVLQLLVIYMFPIPEQLITMFHSEVLEKGIVSVVMSAPSVTFVYIWAAIGVKRLHDRNKSGWWAVLYLGVPSLLLVMMLAAADANGQLHGWAAALMIPFLILLLASFVELACLKGTAGPNQYGPDPLAAQIPGPMPAPSPTGPIIPPVHGG